MVFLCTASLFSLGNKRSFVQTIVISRPGEAHITMSMSKSNGPRGIPIKSYTCIVILDPHLLRVYGSPCESFRRHELALTLSFVRKCPVTLSFKNLY
ncbi:hypothetical protein DKX38_012843 [Salix brachista]|uniref:Uncharacterized protein n=1 Tax=Salix brachista TaxID=2182728 RepID=A0A5N5LRK2_9ROSI|nr:hypothetical protein DKX38_012843 [Salix brachista]